MYNVLKLFYSNAEFWTNPGEEPMDPRFWEREVKLPPLEIMSGYASERQSMYDGCIL